MLAGIPGLIFRRKINNGTALGMLGHQPGPVPLFVLARPAGLPGSIILFGWHQARGQYLFFDHGRDFIFRDTVLV